MSRAKSREGYVRGGGVGPQGPQGQENVGQEQSPITSDLLNVFIVTYKCIILNKLFQRFCLCHMYTDMSTLFYLS